METFDRSSVGEIADAPANSSPNSDSGALRCPMASGCYLDDLALAWQDIEGPDDFVGSEMVRQADLLLAQDPPCGCVARMRDVIARGVARSAVA